MSACAAVAAAKARTGLTDAEIAAKVGSTEGRITEIINSKATPTHEEYQALAAALGITEPVPHDSHHPNA